MENKFTTSQFVSYTKHEEIRRQRDTKHASAHKVGQQKLMRNLGILAVAAFGLWGIVAMESDKNVDAKNISSSQTAQEIEYDEEFGKLKFVSAGEEQVISVSADGYSFPMEGEVVTTFAETGTQVIIKSETAGCTVRSISSGTVSKTGDNYVVIHNADGSLTTYTGLRPGLMAGDLVESGNIIGQLSDKELTLHTVSGVGYVDPLDAGSFSRVTCDQTE